ncbi:uncharacterized protein LOC132735542 [Ruditapes philippinarum]|uniref:uncharacterized protein LOC132735542 n=1 Tax=Ruditapes philippinarum TaxID=129788 RepID=UPI00295BED2B|nr:uncharacterized protein LOC132735542 [Ruditapes philippinarum]
MKNEGNTQEAIPLLRDDWVREECKRFFKSEYSKISKLKKSYKSLRKMFLILAILCIVLIICTISVLAVILVSFRMETRPNGNDKSESHGIFKTMEVAFKEILFEKLRSQRAKEIIRRQIFCDKCQEKGRHSYQSKDFGDPGELECCQENAFNDFTTFKDTFTEKLEKHSSSLQEHHNRIIKLEDEVIILQHNRENKDVHRHSASSQSIFERTVLQSRVAVNNKLLNKLLNWKRSSMQLKGNAKSNSIEWQQDIKIGDIISTNNNGLHVQSGGTFYMYTNIQFKKDNCTDGEVFQYEIIEDSGGHNNAIAHVRQSCMGVTNSFSLSLNFQKVIKVPSHETASYYLNVISHSLSPYPWAHVFGILEI